MAEQPIQTTHTGSLPRPAHLEELLAGSDRGETFETAVREAIGEVVRRQAEVGIDIANDGEQSRVSYAVDVTGRLSGFGEGTVERDWPTDLEEFPEYGERVLGESENIGGPVAVDDLSYVGGAELRRELGRFENATEQTGASFAGRFHTVPSPGAVLRFTETTHHSSRREYVFDLAEALATEYELVAETGATLQVDAPDLLAGFTLTYRDESVREFRERVQTYIEALNRAVAGVPDEQIRLHACWGNYPGPHHHDVEGHGVKGDYSWITDEALRSPIESMSFFRSHSGGYFAIRANQNRRQEGQRTVYSAENLVVDGTHLYHTSTGHPSKTSLRESFDDLRSFQARLRDLLVRANA
jgi:5-methyltetrahydropteroyltriglutamate--homocysteine methyltransferase